VKGKIEIFNFFLEIILISEKYPLTRQFTVQMPCRLTRQCQVSIDVNRHIPNPAIIRRKPLFEKNGHENRQPKFLKTVLK
jgi:hypothetical protein